MEGMRPLLETRMPYRPHPSPAPLLIGYDPVFDLPRDHLARLVDLVVEEAVTPLPKLRGPGQPAFDPRLCVKVLVYGYATGVRASRQLERLCHESLPYLFLTRGDAPCYKTLCTARKACEEQIEAVFVALYAIADEAGIRRLGRITIDSTKMRADVSPESVVREDEYQAVREELVRILREAEEADAREEREGAMATRTGKEVSSEQMRDILRRVRRRIKKQGAPGEGTLEAEAAERHEAVHHSKRMLERVGEAVKAIDEAQEANLKHVSVTDPDARMMGEGRNKRIQPCHSLQIGADQGLLVAAYTSQEANDNPELESVVEAARANEPDGVVAVDADSGYFGGDAVARLIEAGVDTCIPDARTACDLHRGDPVGTERRRQWGEVPFVYDEGADSYRCPEGNRLSLKRTCLHGGQTVKAYRAERSCAECPLAAKCLKHPTAKRRTLKRGVHEPVLAQARARFEALGHRQRYRLRGPAIETVFGFLRATLGYIRWRLRKKQGVEAEARLMKTAYQFRKVHRVLNAG